MRSASEDRLKQQFRLLLVSQLLEPSCPFEVLGNRFCESLHVVVVVQVVDCNIRLVNIEIVDADSDAVLSHAGHLVSVLGLEVLEVPVVQVLLEGEAPSNVEEPSEELSVLPGLADYFAIRVQNFVLFVAGGKLSVGALIAA